MKRSKLADRRIRLWCSTRYPDGRVQVYIEPRDMWIGVFASPDAWYVAVLTAVLRIAIRPGTAVYEPGTVPYVDPAAADPALIVQAMIRNGWRQVGQRSGPAPYVRLASEEDKRNNRSVIVPTADCVGDGADIIAGLVAELRGQAEHGQRAAAVLQALAAGQLPDPGSEDPLDYAMWAVFMCGKWRFLTSKMTTEAKEAAAAAVLRYSAWMHAVDPDDGQPFTREHVVWWD